DRCSRPIETGRAVLTIEAGSIPPPWPTSSATGRPTVDLCGACLGALTAWLAAGVAEYASTPADIDPPTNRPPLAGRSATAGALATRWTTPLCRTIQNPELRPTT